MTDKWERNSVVYFACADLERDTCWTFFFHIPHFKTSEAVYNSQVRSNCPFYGSQKGQHYPASPTCLQYTSHLFRIIFFKLALWNGEHQEHLRYGARAALSTDFPYLWKNKNSTAQKAIWKIELVIFPPCPVNSSFFIAAVWRQQSISLLRFMCYESSYGFAKIHG